MDPAGDPVGQHVRNPRNVGSLDPNDPRVGTGLANTPKCGDVVRIQIRASADGKVAEARFKVFGCSAAIASASLI